MLKKIDEIEQMITLDANERKDVLNWYLSTKKDISQFMTSDGYADATYRNEKEGIKTVIAHLEDEPIPAISVFDEDDKRLVYEIRGETIDGKMVVKTNMNYDYLKRYHKHVEQMNKPPKPKKKVATILKRKWRWAVSTQTQKDEYITKLKNEIVSQDKRITELEKAIAEMKGR